MSSPDDTFNKTPGSRDNGSNSGGDVSRTTSDGDLINELRAADPANDVKPSQGFVAKVVASTQGWATSGIGFEDAAGREGSGDALVTDLAEERARRRPVFTWLAAGAAALAVGFGGYGLGLVTAGGDDGASLSTMPYRNSRPADGAMESAAMDSAYFGGGRHQFSSSGLSQDGSQADVYMFLSDPMTEVRAKELAEIFGVADRLTGSEYGWEVADYEGPGVWFMISNDPRGSINFYNSEVSPSSECYSHWEATEPSIEAQDDAQSDDAYWNQMQQDTDRCLQVAMDSAPSGAAAAAKLTEIITAMGLNPSDYKITGRDQKEIYEDGASASAMVIIDGKPSSVGFNMYLTANGISSFDGLLATPVSVGNYDVISAQAAFERLSDSRFGAIGGFLPAGYAADGAAIAEISKDLADLSEPEVMPETSEQSVTVTAADPNSPNSSLEEPQSGTVEPGVDDPASSDDTAGPAQKPMIPDHPKISWPVQDVHIVSAELVYEIQWGGEDDAMFMVPTYLFTDSEGGTWSMIALAEEALNFSSN